MNEIVNIQNIDVDNDKSLQTLLRAIRLSQGEFSLILLRCNYASLQTSIVQRITEISPIPIREIYLPDSVKTLYTSISAELGEEKPQAVMVFGLNSVKEVDVLLTSANQVREEFRKNFPFPILLWINDLVLLKFIKLATDLENWASIIEFSLNNHELKNLLLQKIDELFAGNDNLKFQTCWELETARQDLQNRGEVLDQSSQASLEFILGQKDYANNQINSALEHYHSSLEFWQTINSLEKQGKLLLCIALCYYRKAEITHINNEKYWQQSRSYFEQYIEIMEAAKRQDLIAQNINKLCEVLCQLKEWDELKKLAYTSWYLHQKYGTLLQLAQNYGFLAEVSVENKDYHEAQSLCQQALDILEYFPNLPSHEYSYYQFILAKAKIGLDDISGTIKNLEIARRKGNPQYNPQLYISILETLHWQYFEQRSYLQAFYIKQEKLQVEHQFGYRAFIGAAYLHPQRKVINPVFKVSNNEEIAEEIAASGRQQDVKRLIRKISETEHKLIIIHGQSGVGKSSILTGGLIPALQQQPVGERDALPVLLRVYPEWVVTLGHNLAAAYEKVKKQELTVNLDTIPAIIEQLKKNGEYNLLTVLVFDQFEEFFFVYKDKKYRIQFYEFLRTCLDIPFVKVILSLREDYLHYLLECDRLVNLTATNNNILDKKIRYYLGNFTPEDTKSVIENLTARTQLTLEPSLIDKLVEDLAGGNGEVRPIELQIIGSQLQTDKITTLQQYQNFGTKEKLVQRFLQETIKDCGAPNERVARLVLYLLTDEAGIRPLKTRADLAAQLAAEAKNIDLVLEIFVQSGLVLLLPQLPADLYQLVHDYLVYFIREQEGNKILAELKEEQNKSILYKSVTRLLSLFLIVLIPTLIYSKIIQKNEEIHRQQAEMYLLGQSSAISDYAKELLRQGKEFEALKESLRAGISLEHISKVEPQNISKLKVQEVLQQSLDWIKELIQLEGHQGYVTSVSFSPDGKTLASASFDKKIMLWDVATGKKIRTFPGHSDKIYTVSFSPDSRTLASGGADNVIKLWDVATGREIRTFPGHSNGVYTVSFSPDGKMLGSGSADHTIIIWDIASGRKIHIFNAHKSEVNSISFNRDGRTLASGSSDHTIILWNMVTGKEIRTLKEHQDIVYSVNFSPDGKTLASSSKDKTIKIWKVATGKVLRTFTGHKDDVDSVSFNPDGKILASGSYDQTIKLWDISEGKEIETLKGHSGWVLSTIFSPDGKILASSSADKTIKTWDINRIKNQQIPHILGEHSSSIRSVSFSPNGKILASGSADKTIKLWDVTKSKLIWVLKNHTDTVNNVSFSADGKILASGSGDKTIKLWDVDTGREIGCLLGHTDTVLTISFSPDRKTLASGSGDKTIKLWDIAKRREIKSFTKQNNSIYSISFSPDGKTLASGDGDNTIKLWNVKTGKEIKVLGRHNDIVRSVSFSPDGKTLASGSYDQTIKLWDVDTGQEKITLNGYRDWVNSVSFSPVSFSPDGQFLAAGSADNSIKVWNINKVKEEPRTLLGHNDAVTSVNFSPNGKTLVSASNDNKIILWNNWQQPNLSLHTLIKKGCGWMYNYLSNNSQLKDKDIALCEEINHKQ
jgi:WD40 repeat protein